MGKTNGTDGIGQRDRQIDEEVYQDSAETCRLNTPKARTEKLIVEAEEKVRRCF